MHLAIRTPSTHKNSNGYIFLQAFELCYGFAKGGVVFVFRIKPFGKRFFF